MGGFFFLLALAFAAATGGGLTAFFFALISLNVTRAIIQRARGQRAQQLRRSNPQQSPPQISPARRRVEGWQAAFQEFVRRLEEMGEEAEWGDSRTRTRRERRERSEAANTEADDRYVRGESAPPRPAQRNTSTSNRSTRTTSTQRAARPEGYTHASEAARRAGLSENAGLSLSDVGLIVYGAESRPVVYRESAIPDTVDYVQPFAELKAARAAKGRLAFELVDPAGEVVYLREEDQQLRAGKTSVIPRTRLPIGDHLDLSQGWTLRIYANNVLIADHPFGWYNPTDRTETLREVMSNDGELTADLSALMDDIQAQPMSLDDLLGGDDSTASQQQARR